MNVASIKTINEQARKSSFDIEEIPWSKGVDAEKFWGPENMSHLFYCPSYGKLKIEEKRYYNQVHATGICEQFVFLEELLLVRGLDALMARHGAEIPADLAEAITTFVVEERKHGEMFDRILKLADPVAYANERFVVYKLSGWEYAFVNFCVDRPKTFLWWIWTALIFEEKTLDFYRKYLAGADREKIDPLFHAVHKYHAVDEVRHFQLDFHFVDHFWAKAPAWKKWINLQVFYRMMHSFVHPRRTVRHAVERLIARFPRLVPMREQLLGEVLSVNRNPDWQKAFYSREALPHTFGLFDKFPEMHCLAEVFPMYRPARAV
jgi:hypothetical protein